MTTPPFAITLNVHTSLANHTGAWRSERPVYVDGLPPCQHACPAGEHPQAWLYSAESGDYERAWRQLVADNPFPAIMGRVCYHPCESECHRGKLDTAVGINSVERFLGDEAIARGWALPAPKPDTGRRVLVVGAGPAGLAAAYHLRLLGHEVEIHEAADLPGGMMRYGIPRYRLPREVLEAEVDRVLGLGVTVRLREPVHDLRAVMTAGGFDAALVAVGAQLAHRTYLPAAQASHVLDALALLHDVAEGDLPVLGRRVVVYGGGNTAMDAARTARRLGASDAVVVYRRTRDQMPAQPSELAEALDEGVQVRWLRTINAVDEGEIRVERMELDERGVPQPTGEYEILGADTVVLALGQDIDRALLDRVEGVETRDGAVEVDHSVPGAEGIFVAGDVAPGQRSVTSAVGGARRAAVMIDAWLAGDGAPSAAAAPTPKSGAVPIAFGRLNTWYYTEAPHAVRPRLDAARRVDDFAEVVGGLDGDTALYEARRCLSCGNCFGCDNCFGVCPDNAIRHVDEAHGYEIDLDFCKGCGICAAECPCGAIVMEDEPT